MDGQVRRREAPHTCAAQSFYTALLPQVARIAFSLMGGEPPAELIHDIAVDATLAAVRFRRECALSTWIYSIVRHRVHNWIRNECSRRNLLSAAEQLSIGRAAAGPNETAEAVALAGDLHIGLAMLTEGQRACLLLVGCECRSAPEVAALLHLTPDAVRMNVYRARMRLRRWLADGT